MRANLRHVVLFLWGCCEAFGCSNGSTNQQGTSSDAGGSGGATSTNATGGAASSGTSTTGAVTSTNATGGTAGGGTSTAGGATSTNATGGAASGGTSTTGGVTSTNATGGAASGSTSTAGGVTSTNATGGVASGGTSTTGGATSTNATGGAASGGTSTTGGVTSTNATGGAASGGTSTADLLQQVLIMPSFASGVDGVELGTGRNDGVLRLYGPVTYEGSGYEWSFEAGAWEAREIYNGIGTHCTPRLGALDGNAERLYAGVWGSVGVGMFSYSSAWSSMSIVPGSTGMGSILAMKAGNGGNDGVERLYVAGDTGLFEYSYNGATYSEVGLLATAVGDFGLGDGRNDGKLRIYVGERGGTRLHELTWDGSAFQDEVVFTCSQASPYSAHVGDGRGDGVQRVYAWCGGIYELTFGASGWTQVIVDAQSGSRFYIRSGRVRADNKSRLYVSRTPTGLAEYTWNANQKAFDVDVISGATGGVAIGNGRGDGRNRLYVARGSNGNYDAAAVVELSSSAPPTADP